MRCLEVSFSGIILCPLINCVDPISFSCAHVQIVNDLEASQHSRGCAIYFKKKFFFKLSFCYPLLCRCFSYKKGTLLLFLTSQSYFLKRRDVIIIGRAKRAHTNEYHRNLRFPRARIYIYIYICVCVQKMCGSLLRASATYCVGVTESALSGYRVAKPLT